jgi:hypothetical protein
MNQPLIKVIKLVVDNTQPEYPQRVVSIVTSFSVSDTTNGTEQGIGYLFDVSTQPLADSFTLYDQLTEEQILEWIHSPALADQLAAAHTEFNNTFNPVVPDIEYLNPPWVPPLQIEESITNGSSSPSLDGSSTSTDVTILAFNALTSEKQITSLIYKVLDEIESSKV